MESLTSLETVVNNQTENITVFVRDTLTGDLTDVAGTSTFRLINISDDSVEDSGSFGAAGSAKMVRAGTGIYQYSFNAATYPHEYVLLVNCTLTNEVIRRNVFIKSVSSRYYAYAAQLRIQVDKARKSVRDEIVNMDQSDNDPAVQFFYGYSDSHMVLYLDRGIQYLNAIPPYTALTVDQFPFTQYGTILIDAATIAALESQGIFAIDTDFSYALGGNSLIIDHFSKLSSMLTHILGRFQKTAISWKQGYRSPGLVMYQFLPGGVRAQRQLVSLPSGWWSRMLSSVYL